MKGANAGLDLAEFAGLGLYARTNPRSRRLRLAVRSTRIELVIPPGLDAATVRQFVDQHRDWIEKHQQTQRGDIDRATVALDLRAADAVVPLWGQRHRVVTVAGPPAVRVDGSTLIVGLDRQRADAPKALARLLRAELLRQLRSRAMLQLPQWQAQLGQRCAGVRVRAMRSLWGSLSPAGAVSLNLGLVFLPPRLADYVLAHELAHLRQRNHRPAFWRVVAELYPDWRRARAELRAEHGYVQALLDRLKAGD